jgi:hypothetical protein
MITFNVCDPFSFEQARNILRDVTAAKGKTVPKILVCLQRERSGEGTINFEQGKKLADDYRCPYIETSAVRKVEIIVIY